MVLTRFLVSLAVCPLLLPARPLFGVSTGISGYSGKQELICNQCHGGGTPPTVSLSGPPALNPGATGTFTLTVRSNAPSTQTAAGLNVAASNGLLQVVSGQRSKLLAGEITHTQPKGNSGANAEASWEFKWKAPMSPGNYMLWGAGNSVNQNGLVSGDSPAAIMFFIAVGGVPTVTPTATVTASPSHTPTRTATSTFAAPTSTKMPAPTDTPIETPTDTPIATEVPTHSPTNTPTETETPSETPTPTDLETHSPTATPTLTETATGTPTGTALPTQTEAPSETPSPTDTPTSTPTITSTPSAQNGDANCDQRVTAADLPALLAQLLSTEPPPCGADANGDGTVDDADVSAAIDLIFES